MKNNSWFEMVATYLIVTVVLFLEVALIAVLFKLLHVFWEFIS